MTHSRTKGEGAHSLPPIKDWGSTTSHGWGNKNLVTRTSRSALTS